ncbi:MAG TPA: amino acid permease, partial [Candidatus Obscuribacterales bacterium]
MSKRTLGSWDAIAISIGVVIGVGIFKVPSEVAQHLSAPQLILLAWLAGGVFSFLGSLCYAELSTALPESGGDYIYIREAFGKLVAFTYSWTELTIIRTGSIAAMALLFAEHGCSFADLDRLYMKAIAVAVTAAIAVVNCFGLKLSSVFQNYTTWTKVLALLMLVALGVMSGKGDASRLTGGAVAVDGSVMSAFGVAMIPILWTYGGWRENVFLAGETKETHKSLPFALFATCGLVTAIYMALNVLFLYLLPPSQIAASELIAADVLRLLYGAPGAKIFEAFVMIYALGALNAMILTGSRIAQAMASDSSFFKSLAAVHERTDAPVRAVFVNALWSCVLIFSGSFDQLLFFTGIAVWLFFALVAAAVPILRKRNPQLHRSFLVPLNPWLPLLLVLISLALALVTLLSYTKESLFGLGLVGLGI